MRCSSRRPGSGTIELDGVLTTYAGLEPLTMSTTVTNLTLDLTAGADDATLAADAAGSGKLSGATFESTTFVNPTSSLTIRLGAGDDKLTINSLDPAFAAALTIDSGDGRDSVSFTGNVTTNNGNVSVEAESISVTSGVTLDAGTGAITLAAKDSQTGALLDNDATASVLIDGATVKVGNIALSRRREFHGRHERSDRRCNHRRQRQRQCDRFRAPARSTRTALCPWGHRDQAGQRPHGPASTPAIPPMRRLRS